MADKRILELSLHTSLTLSDVIPIVSNNETKKTTYGSLYYGIRDGVVSGSSQIDYLQITNVPNGLISGSSQLTSSFDIRYINPSETSSMAVSSSIYSSYVGNTITTGKNLHNTTIPKGTPLYFTGSGTSGNLVGIYPADAGNPLRMPAGGIAGESIAVEAEGIVLLDGYIGGVNTSTFSSGDMVYVGVGGGYTNIIPTGSNNFIQYLGNVEKSGVNGSGVIQMTGEFRGLPNIQRGYFWVGDGDDVPQPISTGSFATTGSNIFTGDQTISGSLFVSGTTEFGGNLVPKFPSGSTLGTLERPFREIFVSSGSINIASDVPGDPNTTLSNVGGNILISAGGVRLVDPASFIAATGSFQYISGSMTQVGNYTQQGNYVMVGDKTISGSLRISGSGFINNHRILTDLDSGSYAVTGSNTFSGSQSISGSLYVSGSVYANDEFYINGNKLFNYAQFSDSTTQSGSANTAYSIKFNTTDISHNISVVSGSRITVDNTGIYNLQFSTQLDNASNTNEIVDIWIAITGSNVPNSNTRVAINKAQAGNEGKVVSAWNYMIPLSASQYVELKWSSNGGNIILLSEGTAINPIRPAVPSAIATITQIA
jgi:hypothetical protein